MSGIEARETVEAALRRELFGPLDGDPVRGQPLTINAGVVHFEKKEASRGQFHDADSGQEILTSGTPLKRYGVGVLFAGATVGNDFGVPHHDHALADVGQERHVVRDADHR